MMMPAAAFAGGLLGTADGVAFPGDRAGALLDEVPTTPEG
jgi:hypothetical protein